MANELEFYISNGGKYSFIPTRDQLEKSIYITTSNSYYDSMRGQKIFKEYLDNMAYAEELGYDGVVILEQHGGPNAVAAQSITIAAALAARTKNMRIGTVGAILNSYLTPARYAEEIATLDLISEGRYFFGMPMGIGPNYHSFGVMNPTYARERFREGQDFLEKMFTEEGPFEFDGKFFQTKYANLWPKPIQSPHPEVWVPAAGSKESLAFAAEKGYTYLAVLVPWPVLMKNAETFRNNVAAAGQEWDPKRLVAMGYVHVAETDKQARLEAEAHMMSILQNSLGSPFHDSFPPGHVTPQSLRGMAAGDGYRSKEISETTFDEAIADGQYIVGSPDTVAERIEQITTDLGAGRFLMVGDMWTMPSWMTRKSMTMFAEEVAPRFRKPGGKPSWDHSPITNAVRTASEYGARVQDPQWTPSSHIEDVGFVDIRTAHVPELRVPLERDQH